MTLIIKQPIPTNEEKLRGYVGYIDQILMNSARQIERNLTEVQNIILNNPDGFTKEEIRAKFDETHGEGSALELDAVAEKATELLSLVVIAKD